MTTTPCHHPDCEGMPPIRDSAHRMLRGHPVAPPRAYDRRVDLSAWGLSTAPPITMTDKTKGRSTREARVARAAEILRDGGTDHDITTELGISPETLKTYKTSLRQQGLL